MSDETEKEQRESLKNLGKRITDLRKKVEEITTGDLIIPVDLRADKKWSTEKILELVKDVLLSKLNNLKQLINKEEYKDSNELIADFRKELGKKGVQIVLDKNKTSIITLTAAPKKSMDPDLNEIERIITEELWSAAAK